MNNLKYKWILYIIVLVILGTIAIQIYWNYKNYLINKQQLINDVQLSLDEAIESYYANLAQESTIAFAFTEEGEHALDSVKVDSLIKRLRNSSHIDSIDLSVDNAVTILKYRSTDSLLQPYRTSKDSSLLLEINSTYRKKGDSLPSFDEPTPIKFFENDSLTTFNHFRSLTSKVIFSLTRDSLQLEAIDSLFKNQLRLKKIDIDYGLTQQTLSGEQLYVNSDKKIHTPLLVSSTSPFLPFKGSLSVKFNNPRIEVLKRILAGILLSTLLVLGVVACLFYLLRIIKYQKQLAEVKNDLISNITHEFKTPIATIGVALESIKNFNVINDKAKTKSYLDMSSEQLKKLNVMVEKLLETATLDSDNLELNKEAYDVVDLLNGLVEKHKLTLEGKTITLKSDTESSVLAIDAFHFENAINNVIDNAIKYGGDKIEVDVVQDPNSVFISISDNGHTLTKAYRDRIFEKFFRVPKGNTHDIKGFGIGLYYTKTIIEKHGGTITLNLDNNCTTFKISMPK